MRLLLERGGCCPGTDPGGLWFLPGNASADTAGCHSQVGGSVQGPWPLVGGHPPERQPAPQ